MTQVDRDFSKRPDWEQRWLIDNTWCDHCQTADLGLKDAREYEEDGRVFIEGTCKQCLNRVVSEISTRDA